MNKDNPVNFLEGIKYTDCLKIIGALMIYSFVLSLFFILSNVHAGEYSILSDVENINLTPYFGLSHVAKDESPKNYEIHAKEVINVDYTYNDIWLKIKLKNETGRDLSKYLYFYFATPDDVRVVENGDLIAFGNWTLQKFKPIDSVRPVFKINLKSGESREYNFRRRGQERLDGKLLLLNEKEFGRIETFLKSIVVLYIGSSVALLLFNLLYLIQIKMFVNVYYCLFNFFYLFTTLSWTGFWSYVNLDFYGNSLVKINPFVCGLIVFFGSLFTNEILYKNTRKVASRITVGTAIFSFLTMIFMYFFGEKLVNPYFTVYQTMDICLSWFIVSSLVISVLNLKHVPFAKFYLMSWTFNFIGGLFYFINYAGIVELNLAVACLMLGNVLETILFSFTLSFRYKAILLEKEYISKELENFVKYKTLYNSIFHDVRNKVYILIRRAEGLLNNLSIDRAEKIFKLSKDIQKHIASLELKSEQNVFIDLRECIKENLSILEDSLSEKKIKIVSEGELDKNIGLNRDVLSKSIMFNLLSNAIKFSNVESEILVTGESVDNFFIISISDSGGGFSPEVLEKINQKKIVSTVGTRGEVGTGLGLNIVRSFLEMFGGFLDIETHEGKGTKMKVFIPAQQG